MDQVPWPDGYKAGDSHEFAFNTPNGDASIHHSHNWWSADAV